MRFQVLVLPAFFAFLAPAMSGCSQDVAAPSEQAPATASDEVRGRLNDAQLVRALNTNLKDILFISEGDYPWTVLESAGPAAGPVTAELVVAQLGSSINALDRKLNPSLTRDIKNVSRHPGETFDQLFDSLEDGGEDADAAYTATRKQIKANLTDVKVFEFDSDGRGNQVTGPVIIVVVGKSKSSGKLIALTTFSVAT
jgi:hypothetical protein